MMRFFECMVMLSGAFLVCSCSSVTEMFGFDATSPNALEYAMVTSLDKPYSTLEQKLAKPKRVAGDLYSKAGIGVATWEGFLGIRELHATYKNGRLAEWWSDSKLTKFSKDERVIRMDWVNANEGLMVLFDANRRGKLSKVMKLYAQYPALDTASNHKIGAALAAQGDYEKVVEFYVAKKGVSPVERMPWWATVKDTISGDCKCRFFMVSLWEIAVRADAEKVLKQLEKTIHE